MVLNELQKQHEKFGQQEKALADQRQTIASLRKENAQLEARLDALEKAVLAHSAEE